LIKTDSIGIKIWQKLYSFDSRYNYANTVCRTYDGNFVIGGHAQKPGGDFNFFLLKVNSIGDSLWSKEYGNNKIESYGYAQQTLDSGFILTGMRKIKPPEYEAYAVKVDHKGTIEWEKTYSRGNRLNQFQAIRQLPDGSFIAAGNNQHFGDSIISINSGWLAKIAPNGDLLWDRTYTMHDPDKSNGYHHYFNELELTDDNGFIMCGYIIYPNNSPKNDVWVLKVDSMGCDTPNCVEVGIEYVEPTLGYKIEVNPNPFFHSAQITITGFSTRNYGNQSLELIDLLGRNVWTHDLKDNVLGSYTLTISEKSLPAGFYLLQLRASGQILVSKKLILR